MKTRDDIEIPTLTALIAVLCGTASAETIVIAISNPSTLGGNGTQFAIHLDPFFLPQKLLFIVEEPQ